MSQRTNGRTTGAGNRKPSDPAQIPADESPDSAVGTSRARRGGRAAAMANEQQVPLDPAAIARVLRVVADEMERDSALAQRVAAATAQPDNRPRDQRLPAAEQTASGPTPRARSSHSSSVGSKPFKARIVPGAAPELGAGIPDPFVLRARLGREGLCSTLADLRLGTLRAIVREHQLDADGRFAHNNDAARLRQAIVTATDRRR